MRCSMADRDMVQAILTDESVWDHISEDGTPESVKAGIADFFLSNDKCFVLCPMDGVLLLAAPFSSVALMGHVAIVSAARGAKAARAAVSAYRWIFENTGYTKIFGMPPSANKLASMFAAMTGMRAEGRVSKAFRKRGELHDLLVFGITKEELAG